MMIRPPASLTEAPPADASLELDRIRAEYARRASALPRNTYSWDRAANFYAQAALSRDVIGLLSSAGMFPLHGRDVLDIGCGAGTWLLEFMQYGAASSRIHGIELLPERAEALRARLGDVDVRLGDAEKLPWADGSMDLVSQFVVFTSILQKAMKQRIAAEMLRVVKPGGAILWYDFYCNNPRNPNVRGIRLEEVRQLFPGCEITHRKVTLAPPIARTVVPLSWSLGCLLEAVPFLRTHYLVLIQKPS